MSIVWKYLDKKSAVVNILKDYNSMQYIIDNTNKEIKEAEAELYGLKSAGFDDMPRTRNVKSNEDRVVKGIVAIDVMKERYRQALEYMNWLKPAWNELSNEEQYVLTEFYILEEEKQINAVYNVCEKFGIERSSAYNKKNRALQHLALLLYGKE